MALKVEHRAPRARPSDLIADALLDNGDRRVRDLCLRDHGDGDHREER